MTVAIRDQGRRKRQLFLHRLFKDTRGLLPSCLLACFTKLIYRSFIMSCSQGVLEAKLHISTDLFGSYRSYIQRNACAYVQQGKSEICTEKYIQHSRNKKKRGGGGKPHLYLPRLSSSFPFVSFVPQWSGMPNQGPCTCLQTLGVVVIEVCAYVGADTGVGAGVLSWVSSALSILGCESRGSCRGRGRGRARCLGAA